MRSTRKTPLFELEALPPDLRDLTHLCHPRLLLDRVEAVRYRPDLVWPGVSAQVASLQSLILCSGQHQFRQSLAVCKEGSCRP